MTSSAIGIGILVGAAIAAAGCGRGKDTRELVPVVRLVDLLPRSTTPGVEHGADLALDREIRRVVSAPASSRVRLTLDPTPGPLRRYRAPLPPEIRAWGEIDVVRAIDMGRGASLRPPLRMKAPEALDLLVSPVERPQFFSVAEVSAATTPEALDVETAPVLVPPDAELVFGAGVRAPANRLQASVDTSITAWDGTTEREVWRAALPSLLDRWHEQRVSLGALAGRSVQFRFRTRPGDVAWTGSLGVVAEPVIFAPRTAGTAPPFDVVLLSLDTLRARSVQSCGGSWPTTPALDALARDGALFENATSAASWTLPGHVSLLTGRWLRGHGVNGPWTSVSLGQPLLSELLRANGYATGAFTSGVWLMPALGFGRGFDTFFESTIASNHDGGPHESFTRALDWMWAEPTGRPRFAFLHSYTAHSPYRPPAQYARLLPAPSPFGTQTERQERQYEAQVRYADEQVRWLLDGIDMSGRRDRTLVIVTADHGEAFDEHGAIGHQTIVHDEVARVPLIMRLPGVIRAGLRSDEPVSIADVLPTVLDLLGLPPVADVDGTSLGPILTGVADRLPRVGVPTEASSRPPHGALDRIAIHGRTHTCIGSPEAAVACWDERTDPWQRFDPTATDDAAAREVRALLATFQGTIAAEPVAPTAPASADAASDGEGQTDPDDALARDPDRREHLRALGYIQ